jgi:SNF2 family DNA or RNA helicase
MRAMCEIMNNRQRILLRAERPIRLKSWIPGAYYSSAREAWSVPLSMASCLAMREAFGDGLEIGAGLWAWAKEEKARTAHFVGLRQQTGEHLLLPRCPEAIRAATATRPYQRVGVHFLADSRAALLADQPGLGKTLQTIGAVIESGVPGPYLVVAPATAVTSVWPGEIDRWTEGSHLAVPVTGSRPARVKTLGWFADQAAADGRHWLIANPEMLRTKVWWICPECSARFRASDRPKASVVDCGHDPKRVRIEVDHDWPELFTREWGAIVIDESHRVLCRTSGTKTLAREGATRLRLAPNGLRVALSGTPMRGKAHYLFGTLQWLAPEQYRGFTAWKERYFAVDNNGFGEVIGGPIPERVPELTASLAGLMLRRTKAEAAPDLPPKSYGGSPLEGEGPTGVWLPMEGKQLTAYRSMEKSARARIENGELDALGVLAELTRLKQFATAYGRYADDGETFEPAAPSNKLDWIMGALDERGMLDDPVAGSKIVIASQFTSVLRWLRAEIYRASGRDPIYLTGEVTGSWRKAAVEEFQYEGGRRIMLINTTAGGVAITLDAADEMIVVDETWVPDDQEQLEDRIHRVSRPRPVMYWYLRSLESVEVGIATGNLSADAIAKKVLDGERIL